MEKESDKLAHFAIRIYHKSGSRERERVDEKHLDEHRKFTHGETRKHRTDIFDLRGIRTPDEARHANFVENDGNKLAEVTLV